MPSTFVIRDTDFGIAAPSEIGNKGVGVRRIRAAGLRTPSGFCVPAAVFEELRARRELTAAVERIDSASERARITRDLILGLAIPFDVRQSIHDAARELSASPHPRFAVRSSSTFEDSPHVVAAGVYETVLDTAYDTLIDAIKRVWASAFTEDAVRFRERFACAGELRIAVLVQLQVDCRLGGVLATSDVVSDRPDVVVIDCAGSPLMVTEGSVVPNRFIVSKRDRLVLSESISHPQWTPSHQQIQDLTSAALTLESIENRPQDVEWCLDALDKMFILQARTLPFVHNRNWASYVMPAAESGLRSGKVRATSLIPDGGVAIWSPDAVMPSAYQAYLANRRRIGGALETALLDCFQKHLARGDVSIRPAFWSATRDGDQLPQSGRLTTVSECVASLEAIWGAVSAERLDDYSAEVACLVSTWLPVYASAIALVERKDSSVIATVDAAYGIVEGLESGPHDTYRIAVESGETIHLHVPTKERALLSLRKGWEPLGDSQLMVGAVLNSDERRSIAECLRRVISPQQVVRVEFLITSERGTSAVLPWQMDALRDLPPSPYCTLTTTRPQTPSASGPVVMIKTTADLARLRATPGALAVLDPREDHLRDRSFRFRLIDAVRSSRASVALVGSTLSHMALQLQEYGIPTYGVSSVPHSLTEGQLVYVEHTRRSG
jgi:hypothetical protein